MPKLACRISCASFGKLSLSLDCTLLHPRCPHPRPCLLKHSYTLFCRSHHLFAPQPITTVVCATVFIIGTTLSRIHSTIPHLICHTLQLSHHQFASRSRPQRCCQQMVLTTLLVTVTRTAKMAVPPIPRDLTWFICGFVPIVNPIPLDCPWRLTKQESNRDASHNPSHPTAQIRSPRTSGGTRRALTFAWGEPHGNSR